MRTTVELEGPVVARPIEDVFAFVGDLENSPRWRRTKKTSRDPGSPEGVGARYREETSILGERVKHESEVTAIDPPYELSYTSHFENGVIDRTRIKLETVEAGTRIDLATEVEIDRLPQVLAPLIALYVKQRLGSLFAKLEKEFAPPEPSGDGSPVLIALGVILLATAGMRYLAEVLPDGAWSKVLALLAVSLVAGGAAWILGKIVGRGVSEVSSERAGTTPDRDG